MKFEDKDSEAMRTLRHDIKNQLSNINLLLEQLRYELPDATADCVTYIDMIATSAAKIDNILKDTTD
jgi:hypothetical protein